MAFALNALSSARHAPLFTLILHLHTKISSHVHIKCLFSVQTALVFTQMLTSSHTKMSSIMQIKQKQNKNSIVDTKSSHFCTKCSWLHTKCSCTHTLWYTNKTLLNSQDTPLIQNERLSILHKIFQLFLYWNKTLSHSNRILEHWEKNLSHIQTYAFAFSQDALTFVQIALYFP